MNLKEFLEEEHVLFTRATFSSSETLHEWFKKHDTRLINKVLEEVQMEVEKKLEKWDESAEELEDGWGNYTVCLPWDLKEKKLDISTIIENLKATINK